MKKTEIYTQNLNKIKMAVEDLKRHRKYAEIDKKRITEKYSKQLAVFDKDVDAYFYNENANALDQKMTFEISQMYEDYAENMEIVIIYKNGTIQFFDGKSIIRGSDTPSLTNVMYAYYSDYSMVFDTKCGELSAMMDINQYLQNIQDELHVLFTHSKTMIHINQKNIQREYKDIEVSEQIDILNDFKIYLNGTKNGFKDMSYEAGCKTIATLLNQFDIKIINEQYLKDDIAKTIKYTYYINTSDYDSTNMSISFTFTVSYSNGLTATKQFVAVSTQWTFDVIPFEG